VHTLPKCWTRCKNDGTKKWRKKKPITWGDLMYENEKRQQ